MSRHPTCTSSVIPAKMDFELNSEELYQQMCVSSILCKSLKELDTPCRISTIFDKGNYMLWLFCVSCKLSLFWKGVYPKRKEFAPRGSKLFSFRVDSFTERRKNNINRHLPLEYVHLSECAKYEIGSLPMCGQPRPISNCVFWSEPSLSTHVQESR